MRHFLPAVFLSLLLASCGAANSGVNPDPNHTHGDFAIWIDGKQLDLSGEQYMSGSSDETEHSQELSQYLHLHDGNGHVLHRHKPGLTLGEFVDSLPGMHYGENKLVFRDCLHCQYAKGTFEVRLFVNGTENPAGSTYVFSDLDSLLITNATDPVELRMQQRSMTDDACLYSKTCPERGKAPTEGCIADPTVPCKL